MALKTLARKSSSLKAKLESIFPGFNFEASLSKEGGAIIRLSRDIGAVPRDITNQDLRITATRAEAAAREVVKTATSDANTGTSLSGEDIERQQELERGIKSGKADMIARVQELEKADRAIAETAD
jgi:hypothetical protein